MIIKRYNGQSQAFETLFPRTITTRLFNSTGATPIFDTFDKIKPNFLPNSVFDSLIFHAAISTATADLREAAHNIILAAKTSGPLSVGDSPTPVGRSPIGFYNVATNKVAIQIGGYIAQTSMDGNNVTTTTFTANTTVGSRPEDLKTFGSGSDAAVFAAAIIQPGDENEPGVAPATVINGTLLEPGDWFILTGLTGKGTTAEPYVPMFAVVNNTYELASSEAHGIVKLGYLENTNEPDKYKVQTNADGLFVNIPILISDGSIDTLQIKDQAVTNAKLKDMSANNIIGRITTGDGSPEYLSATDVRTIINVEDGATANSTDATLLNRVSHTGTQLADTISDFQASVSVNTDVAANTAKITNANHSGDVTGDTELTIANNRIKTDMLQNDSVSADKLASNSVEEAKIEDEAVTTFKIKDLAVNRSKIANGVVFNEKLAPMIKNRIIGRADIGDTVADPVYLSPNSIRTMSNLAPILFGVTLLDGAGASLNTPIATSNGMVDGSAIPEGTIWYDTTTA